MVKTGYSYISDWLNAVYIGIGLSQSIVNISGTLISLLISSSDCLSPIRTWQVTQASVALFLFLLSICYKSIGLSLWILWNLVWCVLALIWLFQDTSCKNDYESGFTSSLIMASYGLTLLIIGLIVLVVFIIGYCVGYCLSDRYHEIDS